MSTQSELNLNYSQYILYYCGFDQKDATVYQTDLSNVCTVGFDGSDNIEIKTWLIGGYSQPSMPTLLGYTLANVQNWYNFFYIVPVDIGNAQLYKISTANLNMVRTDNSMIGYSVFDTTAQATKYWSGSAWEANSSKYLSSNGGELKGDLDMKSNDIKNVDTLNDVNASNLVSISSTFTNGNVVTGSSGKVVQDSGTALTALVLKAGDTMTGTLNSRALIPTSDNTYDLASSSNKFKDLYLSSSVLQLTPSAISIWSSDNVSISFTANTPKLIPITNFSQSVNPKSDFSYTSSTGECKYTGSTTRYFRVTIQYSYAALAIATTLTNFISKNGSTSISGARTVVTFLLLGQASVFNSFITDIVQLATNDTIQLGGQLATSNNVSYQALNYCIQQI